MKRALAIVSLALFACSPSPVSRVASPNPSVASRTPVSTTSPSPGTIGDLPVSAVDFSCRLPVVTNPGQGSPGVTLRGGFITFPAARLVEDPAGTIYSREAQGDFATTATPVLYGDGFVPFYDRAQSRWVPSPARQALADGSAYAYSTYDRQTGLFTGFVVDVASGSSRSFKLSGGWNPGVADFGPAGVYIFSGSALGGPGEGVWLLDPRTGAIKQLGQIHQLWAVRDGYAWVARFDPRDKTVWAPMEIARANSLVRIDLATGAETIWFYREGVYPWMVDLDSNGHPLVMLGVPTGNELLLIDHAGSSGRVVYSGSLQFNHVQGDGDRLWFGGSRGVYLYTPDGGFRRVFAYDGDPATSNRIEPAGFCR